VGGGKSQHVCFKVWETLSTFLLWEIRHRMKNTRNVWWQGNARGSSWMEHRAPLSPAGLQMKWCSIDGPCFTTSICVITSALLIINHLKIKCNDGETFCRLSTVRRGNEFILLIIASAQARFQLREELPLKNYERNKSGDKYEACFMCEPLETWQRRVSLDYCAPYQ